MSLHPNPRTILLIGGMGGRYLLPIVDHRPERVDYVEPDRVVAAVQQARLEVLEEVRWDVRRWRGRRARLAIIDGSTEPGGRVMVDRVELFDP